MFTNKFATRLNSFKSNWKEEKKPSIKDLIEKASKVQNYLSESWYSTVRQIRTAEGYFIFPTYKLY